MTAVSPELALVDPGLAAAARATLHEPGMFRPRFASTRVWAAPVRVAPVRVPPRRRIVSPFAAIAAVCTVAVAGAWAISGGDRGATVGASSADASMRVEARRQTPASRAYSWPKVPAAAGYGAELRRGEQVVYSATLSAPVVALPPGLHLAPGRYTWSVTPIYAGSGSAARPVVEETFVVR